MVLSAYLKQRIAQLYFQRRVSYGVLAQVLAAEGFRVSKKYKKHGTISRLPGSGRLFKLTRAMLDIVEAQMELDDETTVTQLVRILGERGYKVSKSTIERARRILGWTFHGSRYCQLIWNVNKEKRVQWALKHCGNDFEDVVWTDESTIQLEKHRMFSFRKVGTAPKLKPRVKHPYKVMVWAGISRKGATNICLLSGSVNSAVYQEVLCTHLLPFLRRQIPGGKLQQDNAPCHTSKAAQKLLKTKKVLLLKTRLKALI